MAKLLNTNDSASRCLSWIRRHQRLTKQVVNDTELIQQIQESYDTLKEKVQIHEGKELIREDAYDDLLLSDRNLDDTIRTAFEKCKQYDRDNIGERVLIKIFPDEKFGDIVRLPFAKEVNEVDQIVVRIENLGEEHELYPLAAGIKEKAVTCTNAIQAVENAIREIKIAEAEVDIAKEALIRKYESNYLDARKKYGRRTADKLFPSIYSNKNIQEIEENIGEAA